jgi:Mor family transcriptional regulator
MKIGVPGERAQSGGTYLTGEEQQIALMVDIEDRVRALLEHLAETPDQPVTSLVPRLAEAITATGHLAYAVGILKGKMLQ